MQKEIEKLRTLGRIDLFRPELVNTLQDTRVYLTYLAYLPDDLPLQRTAILHRLT